MAMQMQKAISNCEWYMQHKGTRPKVPMKPIIATGPLLLHMDFTSIETTMGLDQPPNLMRVLVSCNHIMKHIMAYMTPDETVKNC